MPELPEVEVVRRGLEAHVVGRRISEVEVLHPRPIRRHLAGPAHFRAALEGRWVLAARRRGKYLWLPLDSGDALLAHLGMSGQLLVRPAAAPPERHLRVRLRLGDRPPEREPADGAPSDGEWADREPADRQPPDREPADAASPVVGGDEGGPRGPCELRFVDQRMFGGLAVSAGGAELPGEISHIALDPLEEGFDDDAFVRRVRVRASGIKRILLDQSVVSGVGNIYADEALWRAGVHGERLGRRLTVREVREVLTRVREVMGAALLQGGTSFDALYVNVNGESGYFDRSLEVYGQEGRPCSRCGTPIERRPFMNRSSFFCPRCQPAPRRRGSSAARRR